MTRKAYIAGIALPVLLLCALRAPAFPSGKGAGDIDVNSPAGLDTASNRIGGNRAALGDFFGRLRSLGEDTLGVVSVLHIGDSHVQAGFYPAAVREAIQHDFGNAGRGLIVPLKLSGTNEPPDYLITSPDRWTAARCTSREPAVEPGLGGIALVADGNGVSFTITTPHETFDRVTVFHDTAAPLLVAPPELSGDIGCPLQDTDCSTLVPLRESVHSVELRADTSDSGYDTPVFYGFSLENDSGGVLYHSAGISGNSYDSESRAVRMIRQSSLLMPDLIIVSLGTNDSFGRTFNAELVRSRIERVVGLLRESNPQSAILLTIPMECCTRTRYKGKTVRRPNPGSGKLREEIIRVAGQYGLPYWDFYTVAGGAGAREKWYEARMSNPDRIHLTKGGYWLQGTLLYRALGDAYRDYCAGNS